MAEWKSVSSRAGSTPTEDLIAAIRRLVTADLNSGRPPLGVVARALATSERSLTRRLAERGTTYRAVVDDARRRVAEALLADGGHTASEVGYLIGFSDPSAFHRAFRRWTGRCPGAVARSGRPLTANTTFVTEIVLADTDNALACSDNGVSNACS